MNNIIYCQYIISVIHICIWRGYEISKPEFVSYQPQQHIELLDSNIQAFNLKRIKLEFSVQILGGFKF